MQPNLSNGECNELKIEIVINSESLGIANRVLKSAKH